MPARTGRRPNFSAPHPETPNFAELREFHDQAAGLIGIRIARLSDFISIAIAAEEGDPIAGAFINGMTSLRKRVNRVERPLCASCDYTFYPKRPPAGLLLLMPAIDMPTMTIVAGICGACTTKPDAEIAAAFGTYGKTLWPDLRVINAAHVSRDRGRA